TMRGINQAIIFVTGHSVGADGPDWAALAATGQPIVVYMGMANIALIAEALMKGGLDAGTPAAVIMSATTPHERILIAALADIARRAREEGFGAPALIVVGGIVAVRETLAMPTPAEQPT